MSFAAFLNGSSDSLFDYEAYKPEAALCNSSYVTPSQIAAAIPNLRTISTQDRVQLVSTSLSNNTSTYTIDNLLQVQTVSDEFRKKEIQEWKDEKTSRGRKALGFGLGTVSCIAGSVAAGWYFAAGPLAVTALAVASVANLVFTVINYNKRAEAFKQIAGWERSPAHDLAEKRKAALEKGFVHVYESNLKLVKTSSQAYLHPAEVTYLFEQYFQDFCNNLLKEYPVLDVQTKNWMDQFKTHNPVASELLFYAYGAVPEKYIQVSKDFEAMHVFLKNLNKEFDQLGKERAKLTDKEIKDIENERYALLLPLSLALQHYKSSAKQQRDAALAQLHIADHIGRRQVEVEYDAANNRYQMYHNIATAPINAIYDKRVNDAKTRLKDDLAKIKQNEASATAPHYNYARGLLECAFNISRGTGNFTSQTFNPQTMFTFPAPSAPPFEAVNTQAQWNQAPTGVDPNYNEEFLNFVRFNSR